MTTEDMSRVAVARGGWTEAEMLEKAARAVGKIDIWGDRGLSGVSKDELAAMACTLVALGLVAVPPGAPIPERLVVGRAMP